MMRRKCKKTSKIEEKQYFLANRPNYNKSGCNSRATSRRCLQNKATITEIALTVMKSRSGSKRSRGNTTLLPPLIAGPPHNHRVTVRRGKTTNNNNTDRTGIITAGGATGTINSGTFRRLRRSRPSNSRYGQNGRFPCN